MGFIHVGIVASDLHRQSVLIPFFLAGVAIPCKGLKFFTLIVSLPTYLFDYPGAFYLAWVSNCRGVMSERIAHPVEYASLRDPTFR